MSQYRNGSPKAAEAQARNQTWKGSVMTPRWAASIVYRTDAGSNYSKHQLEELDEIKKIVEGGPHWDTIIEIKILRINHCDRSQLTVEQAVQL